MNDDQLRDRLGAADPARDLPAADATRADALLQDVMATELTEENRETGTRHRSRLTWLVAAAAVAVIAGAVAAVILHDDSAAPPTAAQTTTITELDAPDLSAYAGRCMAPNAEVLGTRSVAFAGTVTGVSDGLVTLEPDHWYAGSPTDLVRVESPPEYLEQLLVSVDFEEGQRYLVAADHGQVAICGMSGPYTDELAALYDEAFGG